MNTHEQDVTIRDYVRVFRRHVKAFCFTAAPLLTIGVGIAFGLPAIYQSTGTLLVEQQDVPEFLVRSTVTSNPEDRIRIITESVLKPDNLAEMVKKYQLAPNGDEEAIREAVANIRSNVGIESLETDVLKNLTGKFAGENTPESVAFSISYTDKSPKRAYEIAKELIELYRNENVRARKEIAGDTRAFLDREGNRLETEIAQKAGEIADFKAKNAKSLPDLEKSNLDTMDRTEKDLQDVEREIRTLREQQSLLSSALAQLSPYSITLDQNNNPILGPQDRLKSLQRQYVQLSATYGQDWPDVKKVKREMEALAKQVGLQGTDRAALEVELEARKQELDGLRERYGKDYPDVLRLQRIVDSLTSVVASTPITTGPRVPTAPPDNPAYIEKQVQLKGTEVSLEAALQHRNELRAKRADVENRLSLTPEVEREHNALNRDYEELTDQLKKIQQKQREAEVAENLESNSMGQRFTVLNAPNMPFRPVRPNRPAYLLLSFGFALAAGMAVVLAKRFSDTTVRSRRDITQLLEVPPLAVIPSIINDQDLRAMRWRRMVYTALGVVWLGVTVMLAR
jgi:succinoglycan biosynthesis transport protein ExoP